MIEYKILVKDGDGDAIGEFEIFRKLTFGKKISNYGQCTFDVPANDSKLISLIALRIYSVEIYRNGVRIWSGEQVNRTGDLDDKGDNWVTIICFGWFEQLAGRATVAEKIYEYQSGTDIVLDLIATTNLEDDTGIHEGDTEETTWREKTYTNQPINDAVTTLANMAQGFDFEVTDDKAINIKNFIGVDRSDDVRLEYGINFKSCRISEDFSKPVTRAIVLGSDGTDQVRVEREDAVQMGLYKLREGVFSQLEKSDTASFEDTGDAMLRKYGRPLLKISLDLVRGVSPTIEDIALGDIIKLIVESGVYDINEKFRIFEWTITYNSDNTETLGLTLSNFYNEPS